MDILDKGPELFSNLNSGLIELTYFLKRNGDGIFIEEQLKSRWYVSNIMGLDDSIDLCWSFF